MTDRRKLQAEIDRVLKKVQEGMTEFEECLEKFHQNSNNPTQKEKYENDLKKEIKKLQRLRDQLKTWIQSSEIKDKTPLVDHRKAIESLMERFKVVERETKTKAYSKEGLQAIEKRDLELEERENLMEWINAQLVKFNRNIDVFESELESLQASSRKKKNAKEGDRINRLTTLIERHRYHVYRLEMILRAVDNKAVTPGLLTKTPLYVDEDQQAEIMASQDNDDETGDNDGESGITFCSLIEYYLDHSNEEGFREVTDIYDQLEIDEIVDFTVPAVNAQHPTANGNPPQANATTTTSVSSNATNNLPTLQLTAISTSDDKDNDRDSRTRDKNEHASSNGTKSEEHSQEEGRKRLKSEDRSARSKADQNSSSSVTVNEKSPNPPASKNANSVVQPEAAVSLRASTPPPVAPSVTPQNQTPRAARGTSSYAKSVASHSESDQTASYPPPQPPPLSYSTVVSSTGISYAAVAATASTPATGQQSNSQPAANQQQPSATSTTTQPLSVNTLQAPDVPSTSVPAAANSPMANTASFATPATPMASQSQPAAYPTSQPTQSPPHNPPSLAAQAEAAALQNCITSESLALALAARAEESAAAAAAAAAAAQQITTAPGGLHIAVNSGNITMQPGLVAQRTSMASPEAQAELGNLASYGASQLLPQQPKVTVQVNPVLGITPFALKELSTAACEQHDLVERARKHMPMAADSERARICLPRVPVATPAYYPQQVPTNIDSVDFFARLQPETLFFVFYYMEGTKAQLLAARALKQQQWRYHSKYLMWFQRLTEPSVITAEQETGTYVYFDYERWQTKRKEQFTFEYRYLENKV